MNPTALIDILEKSARKPVADIALELNTTEAAVHEEIQRLEAEGIILGYHAVVDAETAGRQHVTAMIEVRITPERGGGFDRLATRISKFDQVRSCYLVSGGYDLLVIVEGTDLRDVANFVSQKLSSLEGVLSTATHFQLKTYKQDHLLLQREADRPRLPVTP
jgi:DNA-binding Lrp family transcriptional regulator